MAATAETKVKAELKKYLASMGAGYFFSVPVTGFNMHGIADILGVLDGRFIAIEAKSPKAYFTATAGLSPLQMMFRDSIKAAGGIYIVCCNVVTLKLELDIVRGIKKGGC